VLIPFREDLILSSDCGDPVWKQRIGWGYYLGPGGDGVDAPIHLDVRRRRQYAAWWQGSQPIGNGGTRIHLGTLIRVLKVPTIPEQIYDHQSNNRRQESTPSYASDDGKIEQSEHDQGENQRDNDSRIRGGELGRYQANRFL